MYGHLARTWASLEIVQIPASSRSKVLEATCACSVSAAWLLVVGQQWREFHGRLPNVLRKVSALAGIGCTTDLYVADSIAALIGEVQDLRESTYRNDILLTFARVPPK